jgi:N4-gp56 family major capsid protein
MTAIVWEDQGEGFWYNDELSDFLRTALQPAVKFRQLCEPDPGAMEKGLHVGEAYRWNNYGNVSQQGRKLVETEPVPEANLTVSQGELTVTEFGLSVPYTGKLTALAKHDVIRIISKALKNDARKAFDIEAFLQFKETPLRVAPTSGTSTTSITLTENSATATTNNVALGTGHVKATVDAMRERNVPGYVEDDYVAISHPTTWRPFKNELETLHQYTELGLNKIFNGEIGRYEGTRFIEENFIPKGGANDSTSYDPYTGTADAWNNGKSSWAFFFGGDTVQEAVVIPEEIRAKIPGDYGRARGIMWYAMTGFGITHDEDVPSESRIFMWDSAA